MYYTVPASELCPGVESYDSKSKAHPFPGALFVIRNSSSCRRLDLDPVLRIVEYALHGIRCPADLTDPSADSGFHGQQLIFYFSVLVPDLL